MGIAADRDSNIPVNLIAGIGQMPVIGAPIERAPTPAVGDLMRAFRDGFITVADIQKRQADAPVEASNRALTLQANDFKSKRLAEAETMAPATLALERDTQRVDATRLRVLERNLNAAETAAPALEADAARKREHAFNLTSPDENVRAKAHEQDAKYKLEAAYIATFGESPEFIELNEAAKPLSFEDWSAVYKKPYIDQRVQDEVPAGSAPQAVLNHRLRVESEFDAGGKDLYAAYKTTLRQKNGVAYRGTPDYYKALNARMTNYEEASKTKASDFKVYEASQEARAKAAAAQEFPPPGSIKAPTEAQAKTQKFVGIMEESDRALSQLEAKGFDPTSLGTTAQTFLPNRLRSDEVQSYVAARDAWIAAHLRDVSGAAISNPEYPRAAKQFFPVDGDSPNTVAQKQLRRKAVETEMRNATGAQQLPATTATAPGSNGPLKSYESGLGQFIELKDGRKGILTQNPDGTFSLK